MDMFKSYDKAQKMLQIDLFAKYAEQHSDGTKVLKREGIKSFLKNHNIPYTEAELQEFIDIAKLSDSEYGSDEIGEIEYYHNVHAHYIYSDEHQRGIINKVCEKVGFDDFTREAIVRCQNRCIEIVEAAVDKNTILLVDAEQSYIQSSLDSLTRQIQTHYHKDRRAFILNGYQSYLKSSVHHVKLEVERCKRVKIGFGIKLIRGAYMGEERRLADSLNYESPIWDTIQDTNVAYNTNISRILENLEPGRGRLFE